MLWYPDAQTEATRSRTRGTYSRGYPRGVIIHWTAGRRKGWKSQLESQAKRGHTYAVIDQHGNVGQNFPLNKWGYHAGESAWKGIRGTVSDDFMGIEVMAAGKLDFKGSYFKPWFDLKIPRDEVLYQPTNKGNIAKGYYHKFTDSQMLELTNYILWLKNNNPHVFDLNLVLGHDDVSGPEGIGRWRKVDPGAALHLNDKPVTTKEYRDYLFAEYERRLTIDNDRQLRLL